MSEPLEEEHEHDLQEEDKHNLQVDEALEDEQNLKAFSSSR